MGRTIPSWRRVVEAELQKYKKFRDVLSSEDRLIFDDLLNQSKLYAAAAGTLASPVKEVPLILSMLFETTYLALSVLESLGEAKPDTVNRFILGRTDEG
jgi:hypothetical protein